MTNENLPRVAAETEPTHVSKEKILFAALLGTGGLVTVGWVGLIGWGVIHLIGSLTS